MNMLHPIQPFFVVNSSEYYKKLSTHAVISHYYKFRGQPGTSACCAVPDGAIDIIFLCNPERPLAVICGSVDHVACAGFEDNATYFGVRVLPGFFDHIGEASIHDLMQHQYTIEEVMREESLAFRIALETDFDRQIAIFEQVFFRSIHAADNAGHQITQAVLQEIYQSNGTARVQELEAELHYSRRHLSRCFESMMGMDIKRFSNYVRFQSVLKRMNNGEFRTLTDAAAAGNYYDQTHFQKDFKRYTSITPRAYLELLKKIHYAEKLTVC